MLKLKHFHKLWNPLTPFLHSDQVTTIPYKCHNLPVNPGVRAAIFLATISRSRSVLRGFKWTLKIEHLKWKEKKTCCICTPSATASPTSSYPTMPLLKIAHGGRVFLFNWSFSQLDQSRQWMGKSAKIVNNDYFAHSYRRLSCLQVAKIVGHWPKRKTVGGQYSPYESHDMSTPKGCFNTL